MRALSKLVTVAMVTVAFVRAGCTSSTVPPTTTTTSSRQTVIHADVAQFGTLARQELRKSFEAIYRFLYPKGVGKGQLQDFRIWSGPEASSPTRPLNQHRPSDGPLALRRGGPAEVEVLLDRLRIASVAGSRPRVVVSACSCGFAGRESLRPLGQREKRFGHRARYRGHRDRALSCPLSAPRSAP